MPIIENITHTAKHAVKAKVFIASTELACPFFDLINITTINNKVSGHYLGAELIFL